MKTTTLRSRHSANRSPRQVALLLLPLALACFAHAPRAHATCQDACLSNNNTVQGDDALISNTTGTNDTAIGFDARKSNTSGGSNTAIGSTALFSNTNGSLNTANGFEVLQFNTIGSSNTAIGCYALSRIRRATTTRPAVFLHFPKIRRLITTPPTVFLRSFLTDLAGTTPPTACRRFMLTPAVVIIPLMVSTGGSNTAIGVAALSTNTIEPNNIAVGANAGSYVSSGSNNIDIGNLGANESATVRIGTTGTQTDTYIAGISGVTVAGGVGVIVDSNGHLGTVVSSARFKEAIKPMDKASEAILALKPVTFRYNHELDPAGIPQFGLVAEQVEKSIRI